MSVKHLAMIYIDVYFDESTGKINLNASTTKETGNFREMATGIYKALKPKIDDGITQFVEEFNSNIDKRKIQ